MKLGVINKLSRLSACRLARLVELVWREAIDLIRAHFFNNLGSFEFVVTSSLAGSFVLMGNLAHEVHESKG